MTDAQFKNNTLNLILTTTGSTTNTATSPFSVTANAQLCPPKGEFWFAMCMVILFLCKPQKLPEVHVCVRWRPSTIADLIYSLCIFNYSHVFWSY